MYLFEWYVQSLCIRKIFQGNIFDQFIADLNGEDVLEVLSNLLAIAGQFVIQRLHCYGATIYQHIEAETKWPPFSRRHVQRHFLEWKCVNCDLVFTEVCSQVFNKQYSSIGSENGVAPIRRQAIIWTNDGYFTDAYMRHSASMS